MSPGCVHTQDETCRIASAAYGARFFFGGLAGACAVDARALRPGGVSTQLRRRDSHPSIAACGGALAANAKRSANNSSKHA